LPTVTRSAATQATARADIPDITIVSPFKRPAYMGDISVLVDPSFVRFGAMRIEVGQVKVHETLPGELQNIQSFKVQTAGRALERQAEIDIWVWSPAGNPVSATFVTAIELTPQAASQALVAANQAELNALVADTLELRVNTAEAWAARARELVAEGRPARDLVFSGVTSGIISLLGRAGSLGFDLRLQKALAMEIKEYRAGLLDRARTQARDDSPTGQSQDEIREGITLDSFEPWLSKLEGLGRELGELGETLPVPQTDDRGLFPFTVYTDESHARLIDMRGARNLIVSLVASEITPPRQVTPNPPGVPPDTGISFSYGGKPPQDAINYRGGVAIIDDDVTFPTPTVFARAVYDMVNPYDATMRPSFPAVGYSISYTDTRGNPTSSLGWVSAISSPPGYTGGIRRRPYYVTARIHAEYKAYELDGPDWSGSPRELAVEYRDGRYRVGDMTGQYLGIAYLARLTGWAQRQGYVTTARTPNNVPGKVMVTGSLDGINVRDDVNHGGAGRVSFEIRDNRGTWRELIAARAIGQGDNQVVRYGADQGDHTLPSGPNILRARLDVTNGLQTGVSVIVVE